MNRFSAFLFCGLIALGLLCVPAGHDAWAASEEKPKASEAAAEDKDAGPRTIQMITIVSVDVQERDGYTRVVLTPNMPVPMEAERNPEDPSELMITMSSEGLIDMEGLRRKGMKYVYDMQIFSPLGEDVQLKVMIPESARYRFFTIQNRGILDVFKPEDESQLSAAVFAEKRASLQEKLNEVTAAKKKAVGINMEESAAAKEAAPASETAPQQETAQAEAQSQEEPSVPDPLPINENFGENVITLSATEPFGLAAFQRLGYLWVVSDQSNMRIPPEVQGPNANEIGEVEKIEISRGTAYRFAVPENVYVKPEGGRFLWKLRLSGRPQALASASIRKEFIKDGASKLHLTMKDAKNLLRVTDPTVGDDFAVVTVPNAGQRMFKSASFVDVDVIPAYVGAVLVPKSDGIRIEATQSQVTVTRNGGLNIGPAVLAYRNAPPARQNARSELPDTGGDQGKSSLFAFSKWRDYDLNNFSRDITNRRQALAVAGENNKRKLYMETAEFLTSVSLPQEALGYLDLAADAIEKSGLDSAALPEYRALRAVALTGARRFEEALDALDTPVLQKIDEMNFWRSVALAGLGRSEEAYDALPADLNFLKYYPPKLQNSLLMELAELALENDDSDLMQALTNQLQLREGSLTPSQQAGLSFYRGRLAKMNGLPGDVKIMLRRAIESNDPYYATRAELALVQEQLRNEEITPEAAIPRLERIRYAWRGGAIEAETNRELGVAYVRNGELQKGLNLLRAASSLMQDKDAREELSATMVSAFKDIYLDEEMRAQLKPLEALSVYEEFGELLPDDASGDEIIMTITDKLASVELFTRAVDLMREHMETRLPDAKKPLWALKAAALSLRDRKPRQALDILGSVPEQRYMANEATARRYQMLFARAQADMGLTDAAIATLENMGQEDETLLKLKADTAWEGERWGYAADALSRLLAREDISPNEGVTGKQAQMILNAAIAYNLSNNKPALERVRSRYGAAMRSSPLSKSFQVVTRPMRNAVLSDRQSIMSHVFEADMFDDSLKALSALDANGDAPAASEEAASSDAADTDG